MGLRPSRVYCSSPHSSLAESSTFLWFSRMSVARELHNHVHNVINYPAGLAVLPSDFIQTKSCRFCGNMQANILISDPVSGRKRVESNHSKSQKGIFMDRWICMKSWFRERLYLIIHLCRLDTNKDTHKMPLRGVQYLFELLFRYMKNLPFDSVNKKKTCSMCFRGNDDCIDMKFMVLFIFRSHTYSQSINCEHHEQTTFTQLINIQPTRL